MQRSDLLLLQKEGRDDTTNRGFAPLWPLLPKSSLIEFKSKPGPFKHGDLARLIGYGGQFLSSAATEDHDPPIPLEPAELALVVAVASVNRACRNEFRAFGIPLVEVHPGYSSGCLGTLRFILMDLRVIADEEDDELANVFARGVVRGRDTAQWVVHNLLGLFTGNAMPESNDLDQVIISAWNSLDPATREAFIAALPADKRFEGVAPRLRLEGLSPEDRLEGLSPEDRLEGLSDDALERVLRICRQRLERK